MKKITIGVDFSEASLDAVRWVRKHFAPEASVELINSVEITRVPALIRTAIPHFDQWVSTMKDGAAAKLRDISHELGGNPQVIEGKPGQALLEHAKASGSDLIVVGAQGENHGLGKLFGSTPDELLAEAGMPILIARQPQMRTPQSILVAVDDSDFATKILETAKQVAETHRADLTIVHVVSMWIFDRMRQHGGDAAELDAVEKHHFEAAEQSVSEKAHQLGIKDFKVMIRGGSPDVEIVKLGREIESDLIVAGTRGEGNRALPLIGSSAKYVARNATCPLLLVNG